MKILLNNREFIFDNIELKKDKIYLKLDNKSSFFISKYQLKYDDFIDLLKLSLDSYVDCSDKDKIYETIEQYFNYFKITSNPLIKKNMSLKLGYILLNNINLKNEQNIESLLKNHKVLKIDIYYNFIMIMLNIKEIKYINISNYQDMDDEYFTFLDFILDYNIE